MENNFGSEQPTQPTQSTQPVQPVQPVQPLQPVQPEPVFVSGNSVAPGQPKKKGGLIALIVGLILVIIAAVVCIIVFMPKGGTSGSGNSTGGDSSNSGNSGNSGSVLKYANFPDTIDSCPGCVYSYITESSVVYTPNNSTYTYKSLTSDQYKTNWKDVVEDSGHETFLGFILDDDNYPVRAFSCLAMEEKGTVFCLEGGVEDKYGGSVASRTEFYESDKETLDYAFSDSAATTPDYVNDTEYKKVSGKYQALVYLDGASMRGTASTYDKDWVFCSVFNYGTAYCNEYWLK